jgi:hypothetical protein
MNEGEGAQKPTGRAANADRSAEFRGRNLAESRSREATGSPKTPISAVRIGILCQVGNDAHGVRDIGDFSLDIPSPEPAHRSAGDSFLERQLNRAGVNMRSEEVRQMNDRSSEGDHDLLRFTAQTEPLVATSTRVAFVYDLEAPRKERSVRRDLQTARPFLCRRLSDSSGRPRMVRHLFRPQSNAIDDESTPADRLCDCSSIERIGDVNLDPTGIEKILHEIPSPGDGNDFTATTHELSNEVDAGRTGRADHSSAFHEVGS